MGQLELATKERSSFHDLGRMILVVSHFNPSTHTHTHTHTHTVETHRRQLVVLREDLHSAKEALTLIDSQHSLTKEVTTTTPPHTQVDPPSSTHYRDTVRREGWLSFITGN